MSRRSWAFDIAIAAVVFVLGQLEVWNGVFVTRLQGPHWAQATLYGATAALLVLRRVDPLACLVAIFVVSTIEFALAGSPEGGAIMWPGLVSGYSVARWESRRPPWWGLVLLVALWASWSGFDPWNTTVIKHLQAGIWLSPWIIAWLVGALVRSQARGIVQRRSQALAEERNRIARELHDVLGHSVSVMTVQASAVRRRLTPDQAAEREALESVETVGRQALAEMRRMVTVLRDENHDPDREPPPSLDQIDRLADSLRASGLPVVVSVSGSPQSLAPGLDLTAYRLIQEGLTNALRHALEPSVVEVAVAYSPTRLDITVRDDRRKVSAAEPSHGLLGMGERVAVYGGTLITRPRASGGFELIASLPLDHA